MSTTRIPSGSATFLLPSALLVAVMWSSIALGQTGPTVIQLTQVPCQFLESENGIDQGFRTQKQEDCEGINATTGVTRLAEAKTLVVKPGKYVFRVTNKNVSYPLGFWLRGDGLINRARLPSISGGGLTTGNTKDYEIVLKPGEYIYSCPLNPTPDYKLVVKG